MPRICSFQGCEKSARSKELCDGHYRQYLSGQPMRALQRRSLNHAPIDERLALFTNRDGECWEWTGAKNEFGYGVMRIRGRQVRAHRAAYEAVYGEVPTGKSLDHACRNRGCVRPSHLRPATVKENAENLSRRSNSSSGVRGVYAHRGSWKVDVTHFGKHYYGGLFQTIADAEHAAVALRNRLFTHNFEDRAA